MNETWWYRGYKIGERPLRWRKLPGHRAILVSRAAGKTNAFTPIREWSYPEADADQQADRIVRAKKFIDEERSK
jgi:hypothetical protein